MTRDLSQLWFGLAFTRLAFKGLKTGSVCKNGIDFAIKRDLQKFTKQFHWSKSSLPPKKTSTSSTLRAWQASHCWCCPESLLFMTIEFHNVFRCRYCPVLLRLHETLDGYSMDRTERCCPRHSTSGPTMVNVSHFYDSDPASRISTMPMFWITAKPVQLRPVGQKRFVGWQLKPFWARCSREKPLTQHLSNHRYWRCGPKNW